MSAFRPASVAAIVCALAVSTTTLAQGRTYTISDESHAAVAFSLKTGSYGYAYNYSNRGAAERAALARCKADDAKIVGWVNFGWLVIALGEDKKYGVAWEFGDGARKSVAVRRAQEELKNQGGRLKTLIVLCSGDVAPETIEIGK